MKRVVLVEEEDFDQLVDQLKQLTKRVDKLEKGLAEYVGTAEAMKMVGLSRGGLDNLRKAGQVEWKGEGRKVLYLRSSLEALNESGKLRRKR